MSNMQLSTTVNAQVALADMEKMATALAKSGLFGMKTPDQALALMLVAQAEGKHPGTVAGEYHVIQGRASLKADAMLARFQAAGGKVEWHDHSNELVSATFSHPQGGSLKVDWDMARARAAGLGGKDNWKTYPRQMLRARVISEGVRAVYPGVLQGMYTPEEVSDFDAAKPAVVTVQASSFKAETLTAAPAAKAVVVEVLPEPSSHGTNEAKGTDEPEWQVKLEKAIFENEEAVNAFLIARGQIAEGRTWRDLEAGAYRDRVCKSPEKFLDAVRAAQGGAK